MRRRKHVGKGNKEKDLYADSLKKLDYEPTVDHSLEFPQSDSDKEELGISKTKTRRPPPLQERIEEHVKKNWIGWLVGFISLVLSLFMVHFNRDLGILEGIVSVIRDDVKMMKDDNNKLSDKVHSQELTNQEMQFKIKNLENKMKPEQQK